MSSISGNDKKFYNEKSHFSGPGFTVIFDTLKNSDEGQKKTNTTPLPPANPPCRTYDPLKPKGDEAGSPKTICTDAKPQLTRPEVQSNPFYIIKPATTQVEDGSLNNRNRERSDEVPASQEINLIEDQPQKTRGDSAGSRPRNL